MNALRGRTAVVIALASLAVVGSAALPSAAARAGPGDTVRGSGEIECLLATPVLVNQCDVQDPYLKDGEIVTLEVGSITEATFMLFWEPASWDARELEVSLFADPAGGHEYAYVEKTEASPLTLALDDEFLGESSATSLRVVIQPEQRCPNGLFRQPLVCEVPFVTLVRDQPYEYVWELS